MNMVAESIGFWELPKPEQKEKIEWRPIPRVSKTIPFGYKVNTTDDTILLPIDDELNALEQAKKYLKQYSYREVAIWLSKTTNRSISHVGLRKRIQHERKRKKTATTKRQWIKRYEEAIAAVKKIEEESIGAKTVSS
tara:strand:+ start:1236 stop:1646 length:411 start_codon:yes stop_codon:yes gene_type:complete